MVNKERLIESFISYVKIDSESNFAKVLAAELSALGLTVTIDQTAEQTGSNTGNLVAVLDGAGGGPGIVLSCHMDTVKPGKSIKPQRLTDRIASDGSTILGADNKAGIAAIIEALKLLKESRQPHGKITLIFSVCEETGLLGARYVDLTQVNDQLCYVLDSGDPVGHIVLQGPSQEQIKVTLSGLAAHAGEEPEKGISTIYVASQAIANMTLGRVDYETTANIGNIQGGGATNIVPAALELNAEARSLNETKLDRQVAHMKRCFDDACQQYGGSVEFEHQRMYPAFLVNENSEVVEFAKAAIRANGLIPSVGKTGGGSDANIYNSRGLNTVTLGIGEKRPHTLEEYILIEDLVRTADLALTLMLRTGGK